MTRGLPAPCDGHHEMSDLGAACDSDHSGGKRVAPWLPPQRWMVRAAWIEKIMSKTNDTSNLATLEHHDTFADSELDAVTCGAAPTLSDAACKGTHIPNVTIELF